MENVIPGQDADGQFVIERSHTGRYHVIRPAADRASILELIFLIAVHGIVEEVREVVPWVQRVVEKERARREPAGTQRVVHVEGKACPPCAAPVRGIEGAE